MSYDDWLQRESKSFFYFNIYLGVKWISLSLATKKMQHGGRDLDLKFSKFSTNSIQRFDIYDTNRSHAVGNAHSLIVDRMKK